MIKNKKKSWQLIIIVIFVLACFLRFYKLGSNPPSLYWEEVALGYDAYSLMKTGKDHRGNPWPITYISSYMDYKPALYVYALIPSIAVFGLNEFGVRFPSAFFGSLTVLVIYFLAKELFKKNNPHYLPIIAMLLLAISPWHLQFSRAAFEANLALFLAVSAILFFIKACSSQKQKYCLLISAVFFSLSLYAYHGARVFAPLMLLILGVSFLKKLLKIKLVVVISLIIGLLLSFPLIKSLNSKEIRQRFQETSAFATLEPILESNKKIEEDGGGAFARLVHHRFFEYFNIFIKNYFKHFNGKYLFLYGDANLRHSTQEFGLVYHWEFITLILGLVLILKNFRKQGLLVVGWLLIAPVSASITKAAPHSLRTIFGLPAFVIISALGLIQLIKLLKNKKIFLITVYSLLITEFIFYFHFYFYHYPKLYSSYWQYGYKEAVEFIKNNQEKYDAVYLTNEYGRAYMYYLFYTQKDPEETQSLVAVYKNLADIPQLENVFIGSMPDSEGKILWVGGPGEEKNYPLLKKINFLDGNGAFVISETE